MTSIQPLTTARIKQLFNTESVDSIENHTVSCFCKACFKRVWFAEQFLDDVPANTVCPYCLIETITF